MRIVMRIKDEDGQAIVLGALAMSIFLVGAIGLAVDGAHMYAQRQMAQSAADAAATAGILTLFDGTNSAPGTGFTASTFTCTTTDARTPCAYASKNGFGGSATDTVTVDFPATSTVPGVNFSPSTTDPTALIRVTVSRNVSTTFMALLGPTVSTVSASAMAGIVDVVAPVPILIIHPTLDGALSMNGTPDVTITGGPSRSIQVNSGSAIANASVGTTSTIDLSLAGPLGTGADFGYWGGPSSPPFRFKGGTLPGTYLHASPIKDPLAGVAAPPIPTAFGTKPHVVAGVGLCPLSSAPHGCTILTPGLFPAGISLTGTTALMQPGIYYMQGSGGFSCTAGCDLGMVPAASATADTSSTTGTGTGWDGTVAGGGVLIYNSGTGQINIGASGNVDLIGSPISSPYKNILFFEDHSAAANTSQQHPKNPHSMGGGGTMTLRGTIYLTNTLANITATTYQELDIQGNPGSTTTIQGEIIVDALSLGGTGGITMNLSSSSTLLVRQVALVN